MNKIWMMIPFLIANAWSAEGGNGSHGGTVVICPSKQPMLLDLAELTWVPAFKSEVTLGEDTESVDAQISAALKSIHEINPEVSTALGDRIHAIRTIGRSVDDDEYQPSSGDTGYVEIPAGCHLENAIHYSGPENILKRMKLIQSLPISHQAALWLHEGVYRLLKERSPVLAVNSRVTRRIVGALLGTFPNRSNILPSFIHFALTADVDTAFWRVQPERLNRLSAFTFGLCRARINWANGGLLSSTVGWSGALGTSQQSGYLYKVQHCGEVDERFMTQTQTTFTVPVPAGEDRWRRPIHVRVIYDEGFNRTELHYAYLVSNDLPPPSDNDLLMETREYTGVDRRGRGTLRIEREIDVTIYMISDRMADFLEARPEAFL